MTFYLSTFGCALFISVVLIAIRPPWRKKHSIRIPPGPHPIPFFGNILQLDTEYPLKTFTEWGKSHGRSMLYLRISPLIHSFISRRRSHLRATVSTAYTYRQLVTRCSRSSREEKRNILGQAPHDIACRLVRRRFGNV